MAFDWIGFWAHGVTQLSEDNMNYCMLGVGLKADFTAAAAGLSGALAWATDEELLYYCDGAAWVPISTLTNTQWVTPVHATGTGVLFPSIHAAGYHAGVECVDAQTNRVYFTVPIPTGFNTLTKAVVVIIPEGTGDLRRLSSSGFGATGEAANLNTDNIAIATQGVTANQIYDDDVSGLFTAAVAGDRVGVWYERQGGDALDTVGASVFVIGLLLEYN